jgi:hypothetical protein
MIGLRKMLALCLCFATPSIVYSDGTVFVDKNRDQHQLSASEQRQIALEFLKRFGPPASSPANSLPGNNPWQAKKQAQSGNSVTWGQCRDYALQMRNLCYRQARDAFNCERYYEARARKCDRDY